MCRRQMSSPGDMESSESALVKANAEIKALRDSVACLDRKLTQLLSATSPSRAPTQPTQTAFDVLTGPCIPHSRSTATLDRLNAQSVVESEEVAMGTTRVVMHQIVLPSDSDTLGICFGGQVLGWIDICAGLAAKTAARGPCVTASVDAVHFLKPCRVVRGLRAKYMHFGAKHQRFSLLVQGSVAIIAAMVNRTFQSSLEVTVCCTISTALRVQSHSMSARTYEQSLDHQLVPSLQVGVRVEEEDMLTGARHHCCSAYLTFVSVMARPAPGRSAKSLPKINPGSPHQREIFRAGELFFKRHSRPCPFPPFAYAKLIPFLLN